MTRTWMVLAVALGSLPFQARAQEGRVREALESVRDATDRAADADKACRKAVLSDLRDAADVLKRLKGDFDRHRARKLVSDLEDTRRSAKEDCPKRVAQSLGDAIDSLERAVAKDRDEGEEHGRHHREREIPCWSPGDPGCGHTKNGQLPMDRVAFDGLMQAVRAARPNVFTMKDVVAATLRAQTLTSQQLAAIVEEFKPNSIIMLDVIKACASRLVDPHNGVGSVSSKLAPNSILVQEAVQVLTAHRGD
jgi:hypothetical protein